MTEQYTKVNGRYGGVFLVDEQATLSDMQQAMPKFFKTPHGKRETFTVHRGCIIVRNTVQFTGCRPTRHTTVYLYGQWEDSNSKDTPYLPSNRESIDQAKRIIDNVLDSGAMPQQ